MALVLPLALAASTLHAQQQGTLRTLGRLREQANKDSRLLASVPEGTTVTVFEEERGWRRVQLPDGTGGWVWGDYVRVEPGTALAEVTPVATTLPPSSAAGSDEVRALRNEVEALRQRPAGVSAADLEQLRTEVRAIAAAQRQLERRLREGGVDPIEPIAAAPVADGGFGIAAVLVLAGGAVGWIGSRIAQRRRERRQRIRI